MTLKPYLLLRRLLVTAHGLTVYDERFHEGVNIIRGKNSSGKSTITDMIFYVLGGENVEWTDEAARCDCVYGEFCITGLILSLRREIIQTSPTIAVCEGPLNKTMRSLAGWSLYGRQRSSSKESFSQFMFDHLGLPQTKSDESQANVTMYQVLRLLYADQNTDCTSIFRRERQLFADRQDIRRSVGEMLLGIDDLRGHDLRMEYIQAVKLLSQKKARLDSLEEAAVKTDPNFQISQYSELIRNAEQEQSELESQIKKMTAEADDNKLPTSKKETARIIKLEKELKFQHTNIASIRSDIQTLSLQQTDSDAFIASLESDLEGLVSANKSIDLIGNVTLRYCPLCLATLTKSDPEVCPLCKTEMSGDAITGGRLRLEQELKHQISESKQIYIKRQELLVELQNKLKVALRERDKTLTELRSIVTPIIHVDERVARLLKHFGYLTRSIEDLTRLETLQDTFRMIEHEVQKIRSQVESIERELKRRREEQEQRRNYCQNKIGDLTINVLHNDVVDLYNDTLNNAEGLVFSFEKDFLSVRFGRLSASTQAFLKNSFYLGLLKFSIEDESSRLPRFFILDNIEDKGMVPDRFRRFHNLLVEYTESVSVSHQVILTTSYIDKSLDNTKYCVGPSYDRPPFTLDLKGEWKHLKTPEPSSELEK